MRGRFIRIGDFVTGERHVRAGLEKLLPELVGSAPRLEFQASSKAYLRALPDRLGMLSILLNDREDTRGHDAVRPAEVVVDFWCCQSRVWGRTAMFVYPAV